MFAGSVISVRGGCNKCSRGNTWNKQPAMDQSDYSISLKYGIIIQDTLRCRDNNNNIAATIASIHVEQLLLLCYYYYLCY